MHSAGHPADGDARGNENLCGAMIECIHAFEGGNMEIRIDSFRCGDDGQTFAAAMAYCREHSGTTLTIPPGVYTITGELAKAAQEHVMRGDWGGNPQRVMFNPAYRYDRGLDFAGQKGTRILAEGVTLLVDGFMEPVSVRDCEDVEIVGLTIDHKRKPFSYAVVRTDGIPHEDGWVLAELVFAPETPIVPPSVSADGQPVRGTNLTLRYLFHDPATGKTVPAPLRILNIIDSGTAQCLVGPQVKDGMEFTCIHTYHARPAILIENAKRITLTDVTIHSQPGMGIVGNRSEDVILKRLRVVPSVGTRWSTNTDATHFTSMKGLLRFENCKFEGQGDDFTNVHGYYQEAVKRESDTVVWLREKTPDGTHAQSLDYPDPGDLMELTSHDTLETKETFRVTDCTPVPEEWMCRVTFDRPLPENLDGWMFADVTRLPRLEVVGCSASSHFARSILVKTRSAWIEGNTFRDVQGPAIVAAAESWWYEGVCPADVVIRRNRIVGCGWAWGEAAGIVVKADADHPSGHSIRNIVIEDNLIDAPEKEHAIFCRNVDGLRIARNQTRVSGEAAVIENCVNVEYSRDLSDSSIVQKGR